MISIFIKITQVEFIRREILTESMPKAPSKSSSSFSETTVRKLYRQGWTRSDIRDILHVNMKKIDKALAKGRVKLDMAHMQNRKSVIERRKEIAKNMKERNWNKVHDKNSAKLVGKKPGDKVTARDIQILGIQRRFGHASSPLSSYLEKIYSRR